MAAKARHLSRSRLLLASALVVCGGLVGPLAAHAECGSEPRATAPQSSHRNLANPHFALTAQDFENYATQVSCRSQSSITPIGGNRLTQAVVNAMTLTSRLGGKDNGASGIRQFDYDVGESMTVHWQNAKGPEWVENAPDWIQENVRAFHRRGLPLVHLWSSDRLLLALGFNNHGLPGLYLTQNE